MEKYVLELTDGSAKQEDVARVIDMFRLVRSYKTRDDKNWFDNVEVPRGLRINIADGITLNSEAQSVYTSFGITIIELLVFGGITIKGFDDTYAGLLILDDAEPAKLMLVWDPDDEDAITNLNFMDLMEMHYRQT